MTLITTHAIERFQERIANLPDAEVVAALDTPTIQLAAKFGAPYVKLGSGHRIVIREGSVVTVLSTDHSPGCMSLAADRRRKNISGGTYTSNSACG